MRPAPCRARARPTPLRRRWIWQARLPACAISSGWAVRRTGSDGIRCSSQLGIALLQDDRAARTRCPRCIHPHISRQTCLGSGITMASPMIACSAVIAVDLPCGRSFKGRVHRPWPGALAAVNQESPVRHLQVGSSSLADSSPAEPPQHPESLNDPGTGSVAASTDIGVSCPLGGCSLPPPLP